MQDVLLLVAPSRDAAADAAAACVVQQIQVSTSMTQPTSMFPDVITWSASRYGYFLSQGLGVLPLSTNASRLQLTIFHTDPAFKKGYFYLGITGSCACASVTLYPLPPHAACPSPSAVRCNCDCGRRGGAVPPSSCHRDRHAAADGEGDTGGQRHGQ